MADAADDKDAIEWTADVSLLGQPTMVVNFAKVILIAAAIMAGLLAYLTAANGRSDEILPLLELTAACCGGVAVVMLLVMLIVFRNRMTMAFHVDAKAAASAVVDRRARVGGNLAIAAGALAGNPQLLGAGLIARSNSATRVSWSAVRRLKVSRRWRTVSLVNSWRTALILYCTPETSIASKRWRARRWRRRRRGNGRARCRAWRCGPS